MSYKKLFNLDSWPDLVTDFRPKESDPHAFVADRRGEVYQYTKELELAINVALVTGRPLLLAGLPGSGKSSLARNAARVLGWRYYEEIVTSRTQSQDLLWKVDLLKRLYDANEAGRPTGSGAEISKWRRYVSPGVLWWAFAPESAAGGGDNGEPMHSDPGEAGDPRNAVRRPGTPENEAQIPAVVLLDEIDKADPDLPNNLLQALGRLEFHVTELDHLVQVKSWQAPLLVITTNGERSLPDAFVRRCVAYRLKLPGKQKLIDLAKILFRDGGDEADALYASIADHFERLGQTMHERKPSTAEFLDAVAVCLHWKLHGGDPVVRQVVAATIEKALEHHESHERGEMEPLEEAF